MAAKLHASQGNWDGLWMNRSCDQGVTVCSWANGTSHQIPGRKSLPLLFLTFKQNAWILNSSLKAFIAVQLTDLFMSLPLCILHCRQLATTTHRKRSMYSPRCWPWSRAFSRWSVGWRQSCWKESRAISIENYKNLCRYSSGSHYGKRSRRRKTSSKGECLIKYGLRLHLNYARVCGTDACNWLTTAND